jgi:hypothetical protein
LIRCRRRAREYYQIIDYFDADTAAQSLASLISSIDHFVSISRALQRPIAAAGFTTPSHQAHLQVSEDASAG